MTQQEIKEYYKHIESVSYNDIEIIDLYHKQGDSNRHVHLIFEQNKLYYSGDMGTYVFGENIQNAKTFFKGLQINPFYWMEKCEASSEPIIDKEVDYDKAKEAVFEYLKEYDDSYFTDKNLDEYTEETKQKIEDLFWYDWESDETIAFNKLEELFTELEVSSPNEAANEVVRKCQDYNSRFIYACNLIQWVENEVL